MKYVASHADDVHNKNTILVSSVFHVSYFIISHQYHTVFSAFKNDSVAPDTGKHVKHTNMHVAERFRSMTEGGKIKSTIL
jgi:hypothetical protein